MLELEKRALLGDHEAARQLTCEGCACEGYSRDSYPCNTCARNDETLADQYRPPEGEEDEDV